ncbi:hypothetical protein Unana1_02290 [Umbelopsis nana]
MNVRSIADVAAGDLRRSIDHKNYGAALTGEFEYCEYTADPTKDYECLMFIDPDTYTGIKCRTTVFDRCLVELSVIARVWYSRWVDDALLDVCLAEAVTQDTNVPVLQVIERARSLRAQSMITTHSLFLSLRHIEPDSKSFNLVATVLAKSPMFVDEDNNPYFMAQLIEGDVTTFVAFQGKNIRMFYSEMEVDHYYAFTGLEQAVELAHIQHMLLFNGDVSDFCRLSNEQASLALEAMANVNPSPTPALSVQSRDRFRNDLFLINYTGVVTGVIDQVLGWYVLDDNVLLVLTQYPAYYPLASLCQGTRITVRRVHTVRIICNKLGSAFLKRCCQCDPSTSESNATGDEPKLSSSWNTLVACTHTNILIDKFPDTAQVNDRLITNSSLMTAFLANNGFVHKYGYLNMVTWIEAFLSLQRKMQDAHEDRLSAIAATNLLLKQTGNDLGPNTPRDLVREFVSHDNDCLVCSHPTLSGGEQATTFYNLTNYPVLSQLKAELTHIPQLKHVAIVSSIRKENAFTHLAMQAYNYNLTSTMPFACILVGYISAGVDGRLYFADSTDRLPLIIRHKGEQSDVVDALYVITKCTIMEEDMGYIDESGKRIEGVCRYLLVDIDGIINLQPAKQRITFCTSIPTSAQLQRLFTYDSSPELSFITQSNTYVINVEHIQFPSLTVNDFGKQYLVAYVHVILFDMAETSSATSHTLKGEPARHTLSLTSASLSLALLPSLKCGGWYVLTNGTEQVQSLPPTISLGSSAIVYPILPNHGMFKLRQYAMDTQLMQQMTMVQPIGKESVSSVQDILNIDFSVEGDLETPGVLSNGFYNKLVSFEGYVVLKEFTESRVRDSEMNKYTAPFYDHLGIGTGKPNRWLYFRIRSIETQDTIDFYYDVSQTLYPLSLFPGCKVIVQNIVLKSSKHTKAVYGVVVPCTRIEVVEAVAGRPIPGEQEQEADARALVQFIRDTDTKIYKTICNVKSIQQLTIGWICLECGQAIINHTCYSMCSKGRKMFLAEAVVTVIDGTADITVSVDGEDLVMALLRLSPNEVVKLKEAAFVHGEMTFSNWFGTGNTSVVRGDTVTESATTTTRGRTLQSICTNPKVFDCIALHVKRIIRKSLAPKAPKTLYEQLEVLPIKLSSNGDDSDTVQSLSFTRVRLKAIKIEPVDVITQASALL